MRWSGEASSPPRSSARRPRSACWACPYPEEVGGTGLDTLAYAITVEELSRVSGSVGIIVSAHTSLGCAPLFMSGTPEQQERFLRPLASGAKLGAYGLTEAGRGLRLARDADAGASRRRRVGAQRQQALHHQRRRGGDLHRHRRHGPKRGLGQDQRLHRRGGDAGLLHRPDGGEDGAPRQQHRRAPLRGLPHPGREPARRGGRRGSALPEDPRRRPDRDRRHGARPGPGRVRGGIGLCQGARAVRAADRLVPGDRLQDRRHGDPDRRGAPDGLPRRLAEGQRPAVLDRGGDGQALRQRGGDAR